MHGSAVLLSWETFQSVQLHQPSCVKHLKLASFHATRRGHSRIKEIREERTRFSTTVSAMGSEYPQLSCVEVFIGLIRHSKICKQLWLKHTITNKIRVGHLRQGKERRKEGKDQMKFVITLAW